MKHGGFVPRLTRVIVPGKRQVGYPVSCFFAKGDESPREYIERVTPLAVKSVLTRRSAESDVRSG